MKKLLYFLSAVLVATPIVLGIVSLVMPGNYLQYINDLDLGQLNDLKPLKSENNTKGEFTNDNIFNCDYNETLTKKIDSYFDYGKSDDKIGYYEIAKKLFKLNNANPTYKDWLDTNFKLTRANEDGAYKLIVNYKGKTKIAKFTSNKDIQLTLNSVYDENNLLSVEDGSKKAILDGMQKSNSKNSQIRFELNNRLWRDKGEKEFGTVHSVSIDNTGKGTAQIYDASGTYGGVLKQKIQIVPYAPLSFGPEGNPYYYYNDVTKEQQKRLNYIDSKYMATQLNKDKHVVLFGLDGFRYDKFKELVLDKLDQKDKLITTKDFYSQPWESVFGWKNIVSGSIDGSKNNIFKIVNNSENHSEVSAVANIEWQDFDNKVFSNSTKSGLENIKDSFNNNGEYRNWYSGNPWSKDFDVRNELLKQLKSDPDNELWKDVNIPEHPGSLGVPHFDTNGIGNPTTNELKVNALKSWTSFKLFQQLLNENKLKTMPNLAFQYDDIADDEGHDWNVAGLPGDDYYKSEALINTCEVYVKELNEIFNKYISDPNYLLLIVTDHGRDENDASHKGWSVTARRSFYVSNKGLSQYTEGPLNQSSLKEIVFNFLKK